MEKASKGGYEVVLDPGNVNTEALHQVLASAVTHPPCFSLVSWKVGVEYIKSFSCHLSDIMLLYLSLWPYL